jgi:Leucine-rich repeat (LRR) protein
MSVLFAVHSVFSMHLWSQTTTPPVSEASQNKPLLLEQAALAAAKEVTSLEIVAKQPESVVKLNLSYNGLTEFPSEIFKCTALQALDISNNGLTVLPEEIVRLELLQHLNLAGNGLKKLPKHLDKLKYLKTLDVSNNQIAFSEIERLRQTLPHVKILD